MVKKKKKNENTYLLTPLRQYYVGRVYLLVDAVSFLAKQVKKRTKKEGNARVKPAVTSKRGAPPRVDPATQQHSEWYEGHRK